MISNKPFQLSVNNTNHGKVTWKSSNAKVARVDSTGKVTGLKKGMVTITATSADKTTTKVKLKIIAATTSITFKQNPVELYAGKKATVKAVYSKGSNDPVTWSSSDTSVATVSNKGVVAGKKQGTVTITVKALSGRTASVRVIVHTKAKTVKWVSTPPATLKVGQTANVSMQITAPANCDDTVKWTSSNGRVLSVTPSADGKSAVVQGLKKGKASLIVRTGSGKKLTYSLTVDTNENQYITQANYKSPYYIVVYIGSQSVVVYGKDDYGTYTKVVKTFTCSTGKSSSPTPTGMYSICTKYRWRLLVGNVYGQYSSGIGGPYLFHSVPYKKQDVSSVTDEEYDKLGRGASHGCIRMCVRDCKWIYDNAPIGTQVHVVSASGPAGSGVPQRNTEPIYSGWEPTDQWAPNNPYFAN